MSKNQFLTSLELSMTAEKNRRKLKLEEENIY